MNERQMDELLAWYVNGTLDEAERREVEAWLENNPEAQMQLAEYRFLHESVHEVGSEEPQFDTETGLDRLMARLEAEEAANETARPEVAPSRLRQWFQRLAEALQWQRTPAFARVAMVTQLGGVLALGAVLLIPGQSQEEYQVLTGTPPAAVVAGPQAAIGFKPETPLAEVQALLRDQNARLVDGPSSVGTYRIRLPEGAPLEARLAALKAHPAVIYLERVQP